MTEDYFFYFTQKMSEIKLKPKEFPTIYSNLPYQRMNEITMMWMKEAHGNTLLLYTMLDESERLTLLVYLFATYDVEFYRFISD